MTPETAQKGKKTPVLAYIAMLEYYAEPVGGLGQLGDDALLQKREAVDAAGLAALQNDHGAALTVVARVKPIPQREGLV